MWVEAHVLRHRPVPRWIGSTSGGAGGGLSSGAASASLSGGPGYSSDFANKSGEVSPVGNKCPQTRSMQHSSPCYSMQPICHHCKNTGHFKNNCPKLVRASASKTPSEARDLDCVPRPGLVVMKSRLHLVMKMEGPFWPTPRLLIPHCHLLGLNKTGSALSCVGALLRLMRLYILSPFRGTLLHSSRCAGMRLGGELPPVNLCSARELAARKDSLRR